jgi:hypothetical protein
MRRQRVGFMDSGLERNGIELRRKLGGEDQIALFDYWSERCRGRRMPSRADIDPTDLGKLLPNLMLIEAMDGPARRYRYRLVGTRVVQATGEDRTGRHFDEVEFFRRFPEVLAQYGALVETADPQFMPEPFRNETHGTTYEVERLMLPLGRADDQVEMILVHFRFMSGPYSNGK